MALYKDGTRLYLDTSSVFDQICSPGTPVPASGIYRCVGCGKEVAANQGNPLPTQNHAQHDPRVHGPIRWQLLVYAQ